MTKKDYIMLANLIKNSKHVYADINSALAGEKPKTVIALEAGGFIGSLCYILKQDNPKFDEKRFKEAC
jgi:hypothetical protein